MRNRLIMGGGGAPPQTIAIFDDANSNPIIPLDGDLEVAKRLSKGKRCLVKKTSTGVAICYLHDNNSELFHDGSTVAKLDRTMGQWMTDSPEYYFKVDESEAGVHKLMISEEEVEGYKKMRRVLIGVTKGVEFSNKLWSRTGGYPTYNYTAYSFYVKAKNCGQDSVL